MKIFNTTTLHLGYADRLRVLFGRPIHLATTIEVSAEVSVLGTTQTTHVAPLVSRPQPGEQLATTPDDDYIFR